MVTVTLDKLYDNYNVLSDAKDKISEYSKEYQEAIDGTKGDEKTKKLSAQILSKFFKHFPNLQTKAIEAIFDICEDDDSSIRIAAMKALPLFCKDSKEYVVKVADILAQLLQLEDPQEYNVAAASLMQIFKEYPIPVIKCIFKQINGNDNTVRDKCIKFLTSKIKVSDKNLVTSEVEDVIITETKRVLQDSTAEEFIHLMPFLTTTRLSSTPSGQQELVEFALEQAELDQDFDPLDKESNNVDRLITCIKFVLPYFSSKIESTKIVTYICDQVLPQWDKISELNQGEVLQLVILRQLAELSAYCGKLENPAHFVSRIYEKLKKYMPPPPENVDLVTMPFLDFSVVECLLYAFHRLGRQCPEFLTEDQTLLKDFRARLMYFSRGVQGCNKALSNLEKKKDLTPEDKEKQKITPKLLSNINTLIKDLFYQPPMYKCNVTLSFKTEASNIKSPEKNSSGSKRHVPITFESNGSNTANKISKRPVDGMKLYTPPSGKFSNNFQNYGGRGRSSRSSRGGRGRGSGRGWR